MDFLVEMDDELDYNESESPVAVKRTSNNPAGDSRATQMHLKSYYSSEKSRHNVISPREEGEAYSDDENDSTVPVESKREYTNRPISHFDKEEGEASSEEDRRYDHHDARRGKSNSNRQQSSALGALTFEESQYRNRLHERYERRERERKRLRDDADSESIHHGRPAYLNEESNSSSGGEDVNLNVNMENSEVSRKHQSTKPQDLKQKKVDRTIMSTVHQTLDKSPPQDNRHYKVLQKEREEYTSRYTQSQTGFSKYDTTISSSQSISVTMSDRIVTGSEGLYPNELNRSPVEVIRKLKSKKSKRERKEKESSKSRGGEVTIKNKKGSKQRKVQSANELDYSAWELGQKYTKVPDATFQERHPQPILHSRSGSLDSISSASSQLSKVSDYSGCSSHSSPVSHRKSVSTSAQHLKLSSQSAYDRDTAYNQHHHKKRYHREARETAPPPESTRHYVVPNQISVKIKHKRKGDKRETSENNYAINLVNKREKTSQDVENQDFSVEDVYKHHNKSRLSKNIEVEPVKHRKHSSKSSKSKDRRSASQKLSVLKIHEDYEQTNHNPYRSVAMKSEDHEQYSEESELDADNTDNREVNTNIMNNKASVKVKETNSLFPSGSKIIEEEIKNANSFNRLPLPPRYPGYSESSSECDENEMPDNEFMNNNGINKIMNDDDEDKYKDFRDDDNDSENIVNEDDNEIDSFQNKPPGKPFYFPSIQGCRSVEEFECLNRIEEGTYGVVYRARDKKVNEIVALKRLKMEKERDGFPITSLREINMLMKAQHENIVTVREVVVGSNMDKIYLVMDYVEHDLKSLMEIMNGPFSVGEVKCLLVQLLRAVGHLHDNWILHRDLKTSNLLLSHQGILKVGDFGLAREYGSPLKHYTEVVVTLWYRAPELLLGTKQYACPIDLWSVGCIFAEFLLQRPLFPGKGEVDELNIIFRDLGTPTERIWPGVSQLPGIKKCVFTEYPYNQLRRRFTEKQISDQGFDLLNSFLTYCPDKRITAEKALVHPYFNERPRAIHPSMFPSWPAKSEGGVNVRKASPRPPAGGGALAAAAAAVAAAAAAVSTATSGGGSRMRYQPPAPPMGGQRFYSSMADSRPGTANRGTAGSGDAYTTSGVDKGFLLRFEQLLPLYIFTPPFIFDSLYKNLRLPFRVVIFASKYAIYASSFHS
ncbi:unnamed protein product [Heterobilharzia americana]|nr:unnamed protein product [Heterobilharzia americana]